MGRLAHAGKWDKAEATLNTMIEKGEITEKQADNTRKKIEGVKEYRFTNLKDLDIAIKTFRVGTPEEKKLYGPILEKKINAIIDRKKRLTGADWDKYFKYESVLDEIK